MAALVTAARMMELPADIDQICRAFPERGPGNEIIVLLRAAKHLGLKAKAVRTSVDKLGRFPEPTILILKANEDFTSLRSFARLNKNRRT